jgi:hypothetical protein
VLLVGAWALAAALPLVIEVDALAQPTQERRSFEVASVKALLDDDPNSDYVPRQSGDRITMHNAALGTIIAWAYHLTNAEYQLVAAPTEKHSGTITIFKRWLRAPRTTMICGRCSKHCWKIASN